LRSRKKNRLKNKPLPGQLQDDAALQLTFASILPPMNVNHISILFFFLKGILPAAHCARPGAKMWGFNNGKH
jgi:hypothetical protein